MSRLQTIQTLLQDTHAAIAATDRALAVDPSPSVQSTARALDERRRELELEFLDAAKQMGRDVCSYRLFGNNNHAPTLSSVASALGDFQQLFSVTFDAIKSGPKMRSRVAVDIEQQSSFEFGYAFVGSVGVVLTLGDEQLLFGETEFDQTIATISEITKADAPLGVSELARRVGRAPVRLVYKWAQDHVKGGLGAHIEWWRDDETKQNMLIQPAEFVRLADTIAQTSEEQEEEVRVVGNLVGADIPRKTFHMTFGGNPDIRGKFDDAIDETHKVSLPQSYVAVMRKKTRVKYSTDEEESQYFLIRLEAP